VVHGLGCNPLQNLFSPIFVGRVSLPTKLGISVYRCFSCFAVNAPAESNVMERPRQQLDGSNHNIGVVAVSVGKGRNEVSHLPTETKCWVQTLARL
jgi:hypothetical protein